YSGIPGQTFHMHANKLKSVDAAAPWLGTPPREAWPSRAKSTVAVVDYTPATGRAALRDGELDRLRAHLERFAGSLVGGQTVRSLCSSLVSECGDRAPTFVIAVRDADARHVFEYAPSDCAFVPTQKPDAAYIAGIECFASDLLAVFDGELGPIG